MKFNIYSVWFTFFLLQNVLCMIPIYGYITRPLGYQRVYLPLYKVADTPFHIHGNDMIPHGALIPPTM